MDNTLLKRALERTFQTDYPWKSRMHPLHSFSKNVFVKRDDELGFGISGTKVRKYRSLIPFLTQKGYKSVGIIGGSHSNNVLGLSQLLIENGIAPFLFLRGEPAERPTGCESLIRCLVNSKQIKWIPRYDWSHVEAVSQKWAEQNQSIIIPEGGNLAEAIPGATTLALDILRNEEENGIVFDHLFMEVGSGLSAIATLLAFAALKREINIHLVVLAGESTEFMEKLAHFHPLFEEWLGATICRPENFTLHYPPSARSFGSVNAEVFAMIHRLARQEGFFTDPIYSAKLFLTASKLIEKLPGNVLLLHSGGGMALTGFYHALMKA